MHMQNNGSFFYFCNIASSCHQPTQSSRLVSGITCNCKGGHQHTWRQSTHFVCLNLVNSCNQPPKFVLLVGRRFLVAMQRSPHFRTKSSFEGVRFTFVYKPTEVHMRLHKSQLMELRYNCIAKLGCKVQLPSQVQLSSALALQEQISTFHAFHMWSPPMF